MANTDQNDNKSRQGWTFLGFLNGVRSAFGVGSSKYLPDGGGLTPGVNNKNPLIKELLYARAALQQKGSYDTRMVASEKKLGMWKHAFLDQVKEKLARNFHPQNLVRMTLMVHTSTNSLERVIRDLSITYENPPHRFLDLDGEQPLPGDPDYDGDEAAIPSKAKPPAPEAPPVAGDLVAEPDIDVLAKELGLEGSDEESGEESPFDKWLCVSNIDAIMETVEWYARFLPCVWVRPYVRYVSTKDTIVKQADGTEVTEQKPDPATGKLEYIIYTPDYADVVVDPDNPCHVWAFWYWSNEINDKGDLVRRINFWTKTDCHKLDEQWRLLTSTPHPFGEVPFVPFKLGISVGNFYLDGQGDDLYEGTLELCVLRTIQNARARDSGFKQLVLTGTSQDDIPADQIMGGPSPIYTNEGGGVTMLDMQPELKQWSDMCESRGQELHAKYGLSAAEYKAEGSPQSGFAKKLDRDKVLKENRRTRKFFLKGEQELYNLTVKTLQFQPIDEIGPLPEGELNIDFAEPSFDENPKEQAIIDAQRLKMNIDSIIDILKRENPDLNEVELLKLAWKKKKINEAFIPADEMKLIDLLAEPHGKGAGGASGAGPTDQLAAGGPPALAGNKPPPFGGKP